ncbi:MAG: hypothetical protein LKI88_00640 [Bifidobacterium sp.]|jgi:hypothetical protein|nr:hypothetical protein [Bifidobacterium sp.]MCI1864437.1 hypothetical protein [Bifidobacterium sp.]
MSGVVFYAIVTTCCLGVVVWNMGGVYRRLGILEERVGILRYQMNELSSDELRTNKEADSK